MNSGGSVHQGPRIPPERFDGEVIIPLVTSSNTLSNTSAIVSLVGFVAMAASFVFLSKGAGGALSAYLPILLVTSGVTALASLWTFVTQRRAAKRASDDLAKRYSSVLYSDLEPRLSAYQRQESDELRQAYPLVEAYQLQKGASGATPLSSAAAPLWQRRPTDDDFLCVRVGTGTVKARYTVKLDSGADSLTSPQPTGRFIELQHDARDLVNYMWIADSPVTIPLREHSAIAIISRAGSPQLATLLAQVVAQHAPGDVLPIALYPQASKSSWTWYDSTSPRNTYYEFADVAENCKTFMSEPANRSAMLAWLFDELQFREAALARQQPHERHVGAGVLPHIVICVDSPATIQIEEQIEENRMLSAALALAMKRGRELGVTVISTHAHADEAPADATLLLDANSGAIAPAPAMLKPSNTYGADGAKAANTQAQGAQLRFDSATVDDLRLLAERLRNARIERAQSAELATNYNLRSLVAPAGGFQALTFPARWIMDADAPITIPIGVVAGADPLILNLSSSNSGGDGPHGLLVGQTGSGKSVLLKTIVASLITRYSPTLLNLVLVDFKGGLAFDAFSNAPHTIAYLTNFAEGSATARFLRMMESEILARQPKQKAGEAYPHLVVVIDEFSEMLSGPDGSTDPVIMRNLMRIVRLGRELKIHLLFATQRPDTSLEKLRGAVQYRICLRTNTAEDSTTVLGSPDAANITVKTPGRGYLLRGDNQLVLFQSARLEDTDAGDLISAMTQEPLKRYAAARWPNQLPTPNPFEHAPLYLPPASDLQRIVSIWGADRKLNARPAFAIPIGAYDRPVKREQGALVVDLHGYTRKVDGGPLLVSGDRNFGKTTTLQTLLLSAAELCGPDAVRFFILGSEDSFNPFRQTPHAHHYTDDKLLNIADPFESSAVRELLDRFEQTLNVSPTARPALLLVLDDLSESDLHDLFARNKPRSALLERAIRAQQTGVYVAYSMAKVEYDLQHLITHAATRVSLFTNDANAHQQLLGAKAPFLLEPAPGHGFVYTRQGVDETQICAPAPGASDAEIASGLDERLQDIARRWANPRR